MSRLLARARRRQLEQEAREAVDAALGETETRASAPRSAAADPRRLRGIPMIGGAGGAIPGTMPGRGRIERWSRR